MDITSTLTAWTPVQRVSLLALRLRALDARSTSPILDDVGSARIADAMGLDLSRPRIPSSVVAVHALRTKTLDDVIRRFTAEQPDAVVLDLGCGLDPRMQRCDPSPGVDWYGVDHPDVIRLREQHLPGGHTVGADLTVDGWLDDLPRDRPAVIVTDGLLALLSGDAFAAMARAATAHFATGEFAFLAYSRLAMRNSRRMLRLYDAGWLTPGPLSVPAEGDGIDDAREPQTWGAGLQLVDEQFMERAPEVALFSPVLRAVARISARSPRILRHSGRIVRYHF